MRARLALLLAAFAVIVAVASVIVSSHFGTDDWPTPPLPDTATRLITPTEAVGRISDRTFGDDQSHAGPLARSGGIRTEKVVRRSPGGQGRRGRAVRRGERSGRRSGGRRTDGDRGGDGRPAPAQPELQTDGGGDSESPDDEKPAPAGQVPEPEPTAPEVEAGAGGQIQARSYEQSPQDGGAPASGPVPDLIVPLSGPAQ